MKCACGCGIEIESIDKYGRCRRFVSGHNGRKYSDPKQHKREWNHRNRVSRRETKRRWVQSFKIELIVSAGGQCLGCGLVFDGCTAVFDFHHRDPSIKCFNVNNAALNMYSKSRIIEESQKCDLLCANCHRRLHWEEDHEG